MYIKPLAKTKSPDGVAVVAQIGRVSTDKQNVANIDASFAALRPLLAQLCPNGWVERQFGDRGSGLSLDRDEMNAAEALIKSGVVDVVLIEDISRAYREPSQIIQFVYRCVEAGVRLICPGDNIDTADESFFQPLMFAAYRHGMHIPDTVRRVRRTADYSFEKGGMVVRARYGYRRLSKEVAESGEFGTRGLRVAIDPGAQPVINELRRLVVVERRNGAYLARWLNNKGIANPLATDGRWKSTAVLELLRDPILYGQRRFRRVKHHRNLLTGKFVCTKNDSPLVKLWPELAFMTEPEWLEMNRVLEEVCAESGPCRGAHLGKRRGIARADALFPCQHVTCAICGGAMVDSGKNTMKCLACQPRSGRRCWNRVVVDRGRVVESVVDALTHLLRESKVAENTLVASVMSTIAERRQAATSDAETHRRRAEKLAARCTKLTLALSTVEDSTDDLGGVGGTGAALSDDDNAIIVQIRRLQEERRAQLRLYEAAKAASAASAADPVSEAEVRAHLRRLLLRLATSSFEVAEFLRRIVPVMKIVPIQAIDSGQVHPRLEFVIDLAALTGSDPAPICHTVNCFDEAVHFSNRVKVVEARDQRLAVREKASLTVLATALGIGRMTVRRALHLHQLMHASGLEEPYRVLHAAPASASRWRNDTDREDEGGKGGRSDAA